MPSQYTLKANLAQVIIRIKMGLSLSLLLLGHITIYFFLNFILIYKLNIQIQISLVIGKLYSADLITGISIIKKTNE